MRAQHRGSAGGRLVLALGAAALAIAGLGTIAFGLWGNPPPPQPPAALTHSRTTSPAQPTETAAPGTPQASAAAPGAPSGPILSASPPTHLLIPSIGVSSDLIRLGLNTDGTVQVPPLIRNSPAGWYEGSPTPGQQGPAVILGHVDTYSERSVFYRLGDMRPGDQISVTRADNTVAVFTVTQVGDYPKANFPQLQVYGNTRSAQLRLITCGGDYDAQTGHFLNNIVIYATLTSSHPA
ncbi:class F sortase [Curtobacterium sp. ISL-83]|uniref:class F sortase n=1 Tax=Curtobacterium sp. ISL-83 TaxID=2819145 RepID=UPI001BE55221|nr:class F sortase [Curtobacterium sp. ISL-83]MBT2504174.1 class F sortase [Curtobacterium sp. ISL-83]